MLSTKLNDLKEQIREETTVKTIPPARLKEMSDYAKHLRRKFPHMKPDRIKRKVCEYFKVTLV